MGIFKSVCILSTVISTIIIISSATIYEDEFENDDCELTEPELKNQLFNITKEFRDVYSKVVEHSSESNKENSSVNAVVLFGNTGSGKSTLAQLLSGDNSKLRSVKVNPETEDYIISDHDKIGTDTIVSKTLHANLLTDNETGIFICDSPGFGDTRSPVHELIASSSMKTVLKNIKKIKIVLVVTHGSLRKGLYRNDFTDLLKRIIDFVKDVEKYKDSFYLIGTKVENKFTNQNNGKFVLISDKTVIYEIYHFLKEIKSSLETTTSPAFIKIKNRLIEVIEYLLEKDDNGVPVRINVFRKPLEDGPLSQQAEIQEERISIRRMLLGNDHFTEKNDEDIGYSISPNAELYVKDIISFSEKYMIALSKQIFMYLEEYYVNILRPIIDVGRRKRILNQVKPEIINFETEVAKCKTPSEFIEKITEFSRLKNIEYGCNLNFQNVSLLNDYLTYLGNFYNTSKNINRGRNTSLKYLTDFFQKESENCNLLEDVYSKLSSYDFQNAKAQVVSEIDQWLAKNGILNENNFINFLEKLSVDNKYLTVKPNYYAIIMLNRAVHSFVRFDINIDCESSEILRIVGFTIKLSDIDFNNHFESCHDFKKIIIFAAHTLFIDKDLDQEQLKGKQIEIAARNWNIVGTRRINVDGKSESLSRYPKAFRGKVGKDGKDGGNGGVVIGIGEKFINGYNLLISSNGGRGQDGQNGGDGKDGHDGKDGVIYSSEKSEALNKYYIVYNLKTNVDVYEGSNGSPGSDSGAGGKGGKGGLKGSIEIFNIGSGNSGLSIEMEDGMNGKDGADGIPGKGGIHGCDKVHTKEVKYVLFIAVDKKVDVSRRLCGSRNKSGSVRQNTRRHLHVSQSSSNNSVETLDTCQIKEDFKNVYDNEYRSTRFDDSILDFIKKMPC